MGKTELRADIDEDILARAKAAGVSLDQAAERGVKMALQEAEQGRAGSSAGVEERARKWAQENAEAIRAYNERIEREGCFGEDWRTW